MVWIFEAVVVLIALAMVIRMVRALQTGEMRLVRTWNVFLVLALSSFPGAQSAPAKAAAHRGRTAPARPARRPSQRRAASTSAGARLRVEALDQLDGVPHRPRVADDDDRVRHRLADDLGGGVFKKRLDKNKRRSIILAKGRRYWVYAYLFAKKDRANIDEDELRAFRKLADLYGAKTDVEIGKELKAEELVEICNDHNA